MLAYLLIKELANCWNAIDMTPCEGVKELATLCMTEVTIENKATINQVPAPRESVQGLLTAAHVEIPTVLPYTGVKAYTKEKPTTQPFQAQESLERCFRQPQGL